MGCCITKNNTEEKYKIHSTSKFKTTEKTEDKRVSQTRSTRSKASSIYRKKYKVFLEEYDILEFLGKGLNIKCKLGAFGTVRKVRHKQTQQIRAMKIIYTNTNKFDEKSLMKEIEILRSLVFKFIYLKDNINIIKLYEFYTDEKNYYLITEYCNGGELFEKIQEWGIFNEKIASAIMKQILSAVKYCHSLNIVHR